MALSLPTIASFWAGPKLGLIEHLCLKSFVDNGHETWLYTYEPVEHVPDGVTMKDANDILPLETILTSGRNREPGAHSDKFRYLLLQKEDVIWVDTDAYCVRPFQNFEYLFGIHYKDQVANGVLKLPKNSPALANLVEFCDSEYPPFPDDWPFLHGEERRRHDAYLETGDESQRLHISECAWETFGPYAISYFLKKSGEVVHALPKVLLYPVFGSEIRRNLRWPNRHKLDISSEAISIHFYTSNTRKILTELCGGIPRANSLLAQLCEKHDVDPEMFL
ncbi:MAG: hypothetical protein ACPGVK_07005 [Halocynthiibacter sp.]